MRKKRILVVSEASFLNTGFSNYTEEVMKRLHATGKYELFELGVWATSSDPRWKEYPWQSMGNLPEQNDQVALDAYRPNETFHENHFGAFRFHDALIKFKPDIVWDIRDVWMSSFIEKSPLRKNFKFVWMPTLDGYPQKDEWINLYEKADYIFTYTQFGKNTLNRQSNKIKVIDIARPGADLNIFKPPSNEDERIAAFHRFGLKPDVKIIGSVFRNQKRKLLPRLLETYALFKKKYPNEFKGTFLHMHTSYPEGGPHWEIPALLKRAIKDGLKYQDIIFSYKCTNPKCGEAFVGWWGPTDGTYKIPCQKCGEKSAIFPNTRYGFTKQEMADLYKIMYLFVQPAMREGDGMPMNEALAVACPVIAPKYASMEEKVCNIVKDGNVHIGGRAVEIDTLELELETLEYNAYFSREDMAKQWAYLIRNKQTRDLLSKRAREAAESNFDWDKTAKIWENFFDNTFVPLDRKKTWDAPIKIKNICPQSAPANLTNEQFIEWCYNNLVDCAKPDKEGFEYWLNNLKSGASRKQIEDSFRSISNQHNRLEMIRTGIKPKNVDITDFIDLDDELRILVAIPGTAGDVLYCSALCKSLKEKYPNYSLYFATNPLYFDILKGNSSIKKLIPWHNSFNNSKGIEHSELFDMVFNPHIVTQMVEHYVHNGLGNHLYEAYSFICGLDKTTCDKSKITIQCDEVKGLPEKYISINTTSGMDSKNYDKFQALVNIYPNIKFVQVGGPSDQKLVGSNIINYCGKTTWNESAYIIKNAKFHIGLDSFLTHVCPIVGTKYIALFAATYANICAPYGECNNYINDAVIRCPGGIIIQPVKRSGSCVKPCHMAKCQGVKCISNINVLDVAKIMDEILNE